MFFFFENAYFVIYFLPRQERLREEDLINRAKESDRYKPIDPKENDSVEKHRAE